MKRSELRRRIRTAYRLEPTQSRKAFLKAYGRRERNYGQMLRFQLQYMRPQLTVVCGYLLAVLLAAAVRMDAAFSKLLAIFLPIAALIALTGLGKSARNKMDEIEMASRFSLRLIQNIRLVVIGVVGTAVMLAVSCTVKLVSGADFLHSFALAGVPYLLTTFLCMLLLRKWHSENNIFGCLAVAAAVSIAMFGGFEFLQAEWCRRLLPHLLLALLLLTALESYKYLRESEELKWSFV